MLCCAVLCYTALCYAMLCYVMLCYAVLCCAMLCYAVLCCAMLCCDVLCYAMLCYAMLCYAMLCYAMLSSSFPSLLAENGAIDPLPPSYFVSGCNLCLSPGPKSEMFPLFVYRSPQCLSRPPFSTPSFRCPR